VIVDDDFGRPAATPSFIMLKLSPPPPILSRHDHLLRQYTSGSKMCFRPILGTAHKSAYYHMHITSFATPSASNYINC
jgi:hypothetical protein